MESDKKSLKDSRQNRRDRYWPEVIERLRRVDLWKWSNNAVLPGGWNDRSCKRTIEEMGNDWSELCSTLFKQPVRKWIRTLGGAGDSI